MKDLKDIYLLINSYFEPGSFAHSVYMSHVSLVAGKAVRIARGVGLSDDRVELVVAMSLLHDVGVCKVHAPDIGCKGNAEYIEHGYLGREILEKEGFSDIAPVCERHVGVGLTVDEIIEQSLPLPRRDMLPLSIEEEIVTFADKLYSKKVQSLFVEKSVEDVRVDFEKYGDLALKRFDILSEKFSNYI